MKVNKVAKNIFIDLVEAFIAKISLIFTIMIANVTRIWRAIGHIFVISEVRNSGKGNLMKISNWRGRGGGKDVQGAGIAEQCSDLVGAGGFQNPSQRLVYEALGISKHFIFDTIPISV